MTLDDILDDRFHGCALAAFVEVCRETGNFPPDREAVRRRAYAMYEEELAAKNASRQQQPLAPSAESR